MARIFASMRSEELRPRKFEVEHVSPRFARILEASGLDEEVVIETAKRFHVPPLTAAVAILLAEDRGGEVSQYIWD